jgi:uroporphyrinogen decarboxylase
MNSKERVLNALKHKPTDRIPNALVHGYWLPEVEKSLKEYFYIRSCDTLHALFNIDSYWVEPVYKGPAFKPDGVGHLQGIWGTPEYTNTYSEVFPRPFANTSSLDEIESYPWPSIDWFDFSSVKHFSDLYKDYAVVSPRRWSPSFCQIADLMGFETALMNLVTNQKLIEALVEKITDWNIAMWEHIFDAAPGQIDIAYVGDDPAGQSGMMFSPEIWREIFKPAFARLFKVAKTRGIHVMFHICGNARPIIPDLIDIGMDILMPLQVTAMDMSPEVLKREYGTDISFWGGVYTQYLLPSKSPKEVRTEVRKMIDILGKDGGYILSSSHNLDSDVPPENIAAMYDEASNYYKH